MLNETAEDMLRPTIEEYVKDHSPRFGDDAHLKKAAELYSVMGMGKMEPSGNAEAGKVTLAWPRTEEEWSLRWGRHTKPVSNFTRGYIAAMFAAAFNKPARSYLVTETVVTGQRKPGALFTVAQRKAIPAASCKPASGRAR